MNRIFLGLCLSVLSLGATAQREEPTFGQYMYDDATQLWHTTHNAAGLGRDTSENRGVSAFTFQRAGGDYRRVQEGGRRNALGFAAERFQRLGKYLHGYGRFDFDLGRVQERAWSDVMRTYNANPYISGSDVKGKYDWMNFALDARLSTVAFGRFTYGVGLQYKAGDLSRLRDPRSRVNLLDYQITPSATFAVDDVHTLGLAAYYHRRKEKLPNLNTVQEDPNLMYYQMKGLENAEGSAGGYKGFGREWVRHHFGVEVSHAMRTAEYRQLTTLSFSRSHENVYGDYKAEQGRYYTYHYGVESKHRFTTATRLHALDFSLGYEQGYADEYRQQLRLETDEATGITSRRYETLITFQKRFQQHLVRAALRYRLHWTAEDVAKAYAGIGARFDGVRQRTLLPASLFDVKRLDVRAEGGKSWCGNRLWVEGDAGYNFSLSPKMRLGDATTAYAKEVLLPDFETYHRAGYFSAHLRATYQFPLTMKSQRMHWFVRAQGGVLQARGGRDGYDFGLSLGIIN